MIRNAKAAEQILKTMPLKQRRSISDLLSGKVLAQVRCLSQDQEYTVTEKQVDKDGKPKTNKKGEQLTNEVKKTKPGCDGRIIGNIYNDGKFRAIAESDGRIYCRASRHRLDGNWGFQCWCGNDSRLSRQEVGVRGIELNAVQKEDIETVFKKLEKDPAKYPVVAGKQEVDGFLIEMIGSN